MREKSENIKIPTGLGILSKIRINPEAGKDFDRLALESLESLDFITFFQLKIST